MKNKYRSKWLDWLKDVVPKAIAVFAIAGGAYFVYAQSVTFPGVEPYPVTGVVGQFVGLTTTGFDAAVTNYTTLNNKCRTGPITNPQTGEVRSNVGAHVCSPMEIINSYNFGGAAILAQKDGTGIVNTGPPGFTVFANDCNGWTVREAQYLGSPAFGAVWSFSGRNGSLAACDALFENAGVQIACCR